MNNHRVDLAYVGVLRLVAGMAQRAEKDVQGAGRGGMEQMRWRQVQVEAESWLIWLRGGR